MAEPRLGWKGAAGVFALGLIIGAGRCSVASSDAGAVASAEHCGGEALTATLHTRLSRYAAGMPSSDVYVLQLCHPRRGCHAVASYSHGLAPIAALDGDRLRFVIPMARNLEVFDDRTWVRGREVPLAIEAWPIRSQAELAGAYRALGLGPDAKSRSLDCRRDSAPRPYYPAA